MGITFNLYRNADGSLDGSYPAGDKPAPSWQLPTANYVNTGMPMNLVFPRPEAASWSYAKNAYTGVKWNIPIGIQGGAWPFNFEITNDGGATGVSIGNFLLGVIDGPTGKTTYSVTDDYGVLSWDSPVAGSYTITVRVTDQTGATLDVTVSLTVGTSGWVFVDPVNGNDSTGDGTIGNPFASLVPLHNDVITTPTYNGNRVYLRAGTTPLGGLSGNNGNFRCQAGGLPVQFIGYPSEVVKLECTTGWFWLDAVDDFYLADMEFCYADAFSPSNAGGIWQIVADGGNDRSTLFNLDLTRFVGTPQNIGLANPAVYLSEATTAQHLYMGRLRVSGTTGQVLCSFQDQNALVEHWTVENATLTMPAIQPAGFVFLKDDPDYFTVRNVHAGNTNDTSGASSAISLYWQDGGTNVEICYCTAYQDASGRTGAIKIGANNADAGFIENTYIYRNSVDVDLYWEGDSYTGQADGETELMKNVVTTTLPTSSKITATDNIENGAFFDASLKLTGATRASYLGTHGSEVAQ